MDRKDFLAIACGLCGIGIATSLQSCEKYDAPPVDFELDLTDPANAALANTNGYVISNKVFVINTGSGYRAISTYCTHEGATVNYTGGGFTCPRHGGKFNADGSKKSGPPPTGLETYPVTQAGNILTVKG